MTSLLRTAVQLRLRERQLFLALSIVVGVLAGLSAVLFALCIDRVGRELFGLEPSAARLFLIPSGVSLVTGVLLARWFPDVRGSGVPQTKVAYHLHDGMIPARVGLGKFLTGVLCVGSGHSMGREGPSVQIGASLASSVGRWIGLPPEQVKALVPVGAAGALSAAFNTPVAAVLFSLEEIIGSTSASLLGSTVVASVASVVVERAILGNEPLFHVPAYQLVHPGELVAYALLGAIGGALSVVFSRALLGARAAFRRLPAWSRILQPAIGGVLVGLVLLVRPEVMGVGYDYVDQALNGHMVVRLMVILCVVKMAATIVSYASGNAGGIFAPTLFLGAMTGGALGSVVHQMAPFPTAAPGAYALVGMGALFAGIIRAPMTSVLMVFEITQDYQILVPLMVANLLSFVISRRFQPIPVYNALLLQDDVHLPAEGEVTPTTWTVRDVMTPVTDLADLTDVPADPERAHVHADHGLDVLLQRWRSARGALPVVARDDATRIEGVVRLDDIVRFLSEHPLPSQPASDAAPPFDPAGPGPGAAPPTRSA